MRKWLSASSVYAEKLFRRGHWVPEGLEAAGLRSTRARDLMEALPSEPGKAPEMTVPANALLTTVFESLRAGDGAVTVLGLDEPYRRDPQRAPLGVTVRSPTPPSRIAVSGCTSRGP